MITDSELEQDEAWLRKHLAPLAMKRAQRIIDDYRKLRAERVVAVKQNNALGGNKQPERAGSIHED